MNMFKIVRFTIFFLVKINNYRYNCYSAVALMEVCGEVLL